MADVFQQVDEDLRRERLHALWRRYGWLVITLAVGIVAGTAGYSILSSMARSDREAATAAYEQAVQSARNAEPGAGAATLLDFAAGADAGVAALARLQAAALLAKDGRTAEAVAEYDAVAADAGLSQALRDMAAVQAASAGFADMARDELAQRLQPLSLEGGEWRHAARELEALAALRDGETQAARDGLQALIDDATTPYTMRQRATELLSAIGE